MPCKTSQDPLDASDSARNAWALTNGHSGLTPSLNEPHLLGSRGWGGFPVDSAVDHLAHAVKPPLCSGEPALAAGEAHGCVTETHFQLRVEHKIIPFFLGRILARAVGQMLSMARFYLQPVGLADLMDLR